MLSSPMLPLVLSGEPAVGGKGEVEGFAVYFQAAFGAQAVLLACAVQKGGDFVYGGAACADAAA